MKIIARNTFHNTEVQLQIKSHVIKPHTVQSLRKKLCVQTCTCFWDHTTFFKHIPGYRNSENRQTKLYKSWRDDGSILLED